MGKMRGKNRKGKMNPKEKKWKMWERLFMKQVRRLVKLGKSQEEAEELSLSQYGDVL